MANSWIAFFFVIHLVCCSRDALRTLTHVRLDAEEIESMGGFEIVPRLTHLYLQNVSNAIVIESSIAVICILVTNR